MSAFLICDVTVKNRQGLKKYLELSQHTLKPYGGHFHVQAGKVEVFEGDWDPEVIVVAEFPSMQKAQDWYNSPVALLFHATQIRKHCIGKHCIGLHQSPWIFMCCLSSAHYVLLALGIGE